MGIQWSHFLSSVDWVRRARDLLAASNNLRHVRPAHRPQSHGTVKALRRRHRVALCRYQVLANHVSPESDLVTVAVRFGGDLDQAGAITWWGKREGCLGHETLSQETGELR